MLTVVVPFVDPAGRTKFAVLFASVALSLMYPVSAVLLLLLAFQLPHVVAKSAPIWSISSLLLVLMAYNATNRLPSRELRTPWSVIVVFMAFAFVVAQSELWNRGSNFVDENRYVAYIAFLLAALQLRTRQDRLMVTGGFIVASVVLSAWTVLRLTGHAGMEVSERGIDQTDPNYLTCWIGVGFIPLLVYLTGRRPLRDHLIRAPLWGLLALMIWAIALGASRGAGLALVCSVVVMLLMRYHRPAQLLLVALALAVVISAAARLPVFDLYRQRTSDKEMTIDSGRLPLLMAAIDHFNNSGVRSELLGEGTGSTYVSLGSHSHNNYTEMLLDYGLLGLLLFMLLLALAMRSAVRAQGGMRLSNVSTLVFLLICGISISPFYFIWGWLVLANIVVVESDAVRATDRGPMETGAGGVRRRFMLRSAAR